RAGPGALPGAQPVGHRPALPGTLGKRALFTPVHSQAPAAARPLLAGTVAGAARRGAGQPAAIPRHRAPSGAPAATDESPAGRAAAARKPPPAPPAGRTGLRHRRTAGLAGRSRPAGRSTATELAAGPCRP